MIDSYDYIDLFGLQMPSKPLMKLVKLNKISNAGFTYFFAYNVLSQRHYAINLSTEKQILSVNTHSTGNGQLHREGRELLNY